MQVILLISSLTLLVGMLGQLALLPRRLRTASRGIDTTTGSASGAPHGRPAVIEHAPDVE
jgi:hypothetical protein